MDIEVRHLPGPLDALFEREWGHRVARSPHANFDFRLDHVSHEAGRGRATRLVLVEDGALRGALVLHESGRELACGNAWRVMALAEGADPRLPGGLTPDDAARLFAAAQRVAGRHRLRFFSPHPLGGITNSHPAGGMVLMDLAHHSEDELFAAMHPSKRASVRRAQRRGVELCDAAEPGLERAFAVILDAVHRERHGFTPAPLASDAAPGEDWRTWEQPWHALRTARLDGEVIAGMGWGLFPGGSVEMRISGATGEGRRTGATVLVAWEMMRWARARGHRWMNLCGANRFKREFGGAVVPLHCRLGGGADWLLPNLVENLVRGEGRRVAKAVATRVLRPARQPAET